jgi:hypothetical protein
MVAPTRITADHLLEDEILFMTPEVQTAHGSRVMGPAGWRRSP